MAWSLRRVLFWLHLGAGALCGLVIAVMCATGAALAFQPQLLAWAARDAARLDAPALEAERLPLDAIVERARTVQKGSPPTRVTVPASRDEAVRVSFGREAEVYVDPYGGAARKPSLGARRGFFDAMNRWHRWLGGSPQSQPALGRALTGASNLAFVFLIVSGLVLWLPRRWSRQAVRAGIWFRRGLSGHARDWSWHNVFGLWCAPVLLVLTVTAVVLSYSWASDQLYRATGSSRESASPARLDLEATAEPLSLETLLGVAQQSVPRWREISFRLGGGRRGNEPRELDVALRQPLTVQIRTEDQWPLFSSIDLTLHPITGEQLRRSEHADASAGQRLFRWMRFLHTGEALGFGGQLAAALGSLGGLVLVWTGLALTVRRGLRSLPGRSI